MEAALVSAIAYRPQLLILDGPFSGLDPLVRDELVEGILAISADHNWSVFVSSPRPRRDRESGDARRLPRPRPPSVQRRTGFAAGSLPRSRSHLRGCHVPSPWPEAWLKPETSSAVVRFVVTDYADDKTPELVKSMFPPAATYRCSPCPCVPSLSTWRNRVVERSVRRPHEPGCSHLPQRLPPASGAFIAAVLVLTFLHAYGVIIDPGGGGRAISLSPSMLLCFGWA